MSQEVSKYITIIRPEFMTFCKDACRAAALNHLLFRIAYKCKDQPREKIQAGQVLWYAKTELIASEMSDAWGVCKVRKEVNELLGMNLLGKANNPAWGVDRTKHFFFGSEQCQVLIKLCAENKICLVHLDLPAEVKHLIYLSLASDKSIGCCCPEDKNAHANDEYIGCKRSNHQMQAIKTSDAFDRSIGTITKITSKTPTEDNNEERGYGGNASADANPPAPVISQQLNGDTANGHNDNPASSNPVPAGHSPVDARPDSVGHQDRTADVEQQRHEPAQNARGSVGANQRAAPEKPAVSFTQSKASSPQASAKVETRKPAQGGKGANQYTVYLCTEGQAFKGWYEGITGFELDDTAANAAALNKLGKKRGMTEAKLRTILERIAADKWLQDHSIVVTVQDLASDTHIYRLEHWTQLIAQEAAEAKGKQQRPGSAQSRSVSGLQRWTAPGTAQVQGV